MVHCYDLTEINWGRQFTMLNGQVHVHVFDISENINFNKIFSLLTEDEIRKYNSFRQVVDKERFAAGRAYSKMLLSKYLNTTPVDILIRIGKNKKPFITITKSEAIPIHFNISHSGYLLLIAICNHEIGVDVEEMRDIDIDIIRKQVFSLNEDLFIGHGLDAKHKFYNLWTRKEAFLKAIGRGIVDDLAKIEVLNGVNKPIDNISENMDYKVLSFSPQANYSASICYLSNIEVVFFKLDSKLL